MRSPVARACAAITLTLLVGLVGGFCLTDYGSSWAVHRARLLVGQPFLRQQVGIGELQGTRTMTVLVFGQSNSANHGVTRASSKHRQVLNFYRGNLYVAEDPLLGATGLHGSVWTRLGPKLVANEWIDNVVFVPIGVGGSSVRDWATGRHRRKLAETVRDVSRAGIPITHVFWIQGEREGNRPDVSAQDYKESFRILMESLREQGVDAPVWIPISTMSGGDTSTKIQSVQKQLHDWEGVRRGPYTDLLGSRYRDEFGTHFNETGLEVVANLWMNALTEQGGLTVHIE